MGTGARDAAASGGGEEEQVMLYIGIGRTSMVDRSGRA